MRFAVIACLAALPAVMAGGLVPTPAPKAERRVEERQGTWAWPPGAPDIADQQSFPVSSRLLPLPRARSPRASGKTRITPGSESFLC